MQITEVDKVQINSALALLGTQEAAPSSTLSQISSSTVNDNIMQGAVAIPVMNNVTLVMTGKPPFSVSIFKENIESGNSLQADITDTNNWWAPSRDPSAASTTSEWFNLNWASLNVGYVYRYHDYPIAWRSNERSLVSSAIAANFTLPFDVRVDITDGGTKVRTQIETFYWFSYTDADGKTEKSKFSVKQAASNQVNNTNTTVIGSTDGQHIIYVNDGLGQDGVYITSDHLRSDPNQAFFFKTQPNTPAIGIDGAGRAVGNFDVLTGPANAVTNNNTSIPNTATVLAAIRSIRFG